VLKSKYESVEQIIRSFKYQYSVDTCLQTCIENILLEFLEREKIPFKTNKKEIHRTLFKKGPYGQIALREYSSKLTDLLKGTQVRSIERYHSPSLIQAPGSIIDNSFHLEGLGRVCSDRNCSFPYVTVSGRWFDMMGLSSWSDPVNNHTVIILDLNLDEDRIEFFDPAEIFIKRSSKVDVIPKIINPDRFVSFWDEAKLPRLTGWFERKSDTLDRW